MKNGQVTSRGLFYAESFTLNKKKSKKHSTKLFLYGGDMHQEGLMLLDCVPDQRIYSLLILNLTCIAGKSETSMGCKFKKSIEAALHRELRLAFFHICAQSQNSFFFISATRGWTSLPQFLWYMQFLLFLGTSNSRNWSKFRSLQL